MTTPSEPDSLAERVEVATGPDRELDRDIAIATFDGGKGEMIGGAIVKDRARAPIFEINQRPGMFEITAVSGTSARTAPAYTSSLDAAMTLAQGTGRSLDWLMRAALRQFSENSYSSYQDDREGLARFFTAACLRAAASKARADGGEG